MKKKKGMLNQSIEVFHERNGKLSLQDFLITPYTQLCIQFCEFLVSFSSWLAPSYVKEFMIEIVCIIKHGTIWETSCNFQCFTFSAEVRNQILMKADYESLLLFTKCILKRRNERTYWGGISNFLLPCEQLVSPTPNETETTASNRLLFLWACASLSRPMSCIWCQFHLFTRSVCTTPVSRMQISREKAPTEECSRPSSKYSIV